MANQYRIITDATADLPLAMVKELEIAVVPMEYVLDGQVCTYAPADDETSIKEFYAALRNGKMANTSQINGLVYQQIFEEYLSRGEDILYIAFSSGLSATKYAAELCMEELREKYPERKLVCIDSLCASAGEGLLVYTAVQKQKAGMTLDELTTWLTENLLHLCHWVTVDDLNFLKRGGRISASTAVVGSMLQIKPIIHVDDEGHLINVGKARGRKKSLQTLAEEMENTYLPEQNELVLIGHGDSYEDAAYLKSIIQEKYRQLDVRIVPIGPIIGAHAGPGVIALFFYGTKR